MAFHSTSERYQYIYGSNAAKAEKESGNAGTYGGKSAKSRTAARVKTGSAAKTANPAKAKKAGAVQRNRERFLAFDWKYTIITAAAAMICAAALVYVGGTVRLNDLSAEISALKSEKAELLSKQAALQTEIDKNINLDEIREFAEEKLHMTYPDQEHVIYYNDNTSDYFRQYESVDAVE